MRVSGGGGGGNAAGQVIERHVEVELQLLLLRRVQHDGRLLFNAQVRLSRKDAGSGSGQLALRRRLSTRGQASGCPERLGRSAAWAALAGHAGPASDRTGAEKFEMKR